VCFSSAGARVCPGGPVWTVRTCSGLPRRHVAPPSPVPTVIQPWSGSSTSSRCRCST
jgi:hypothetical protein